MSQTFLDLCKDLRRDIGYTGSGPTAVTGQTGQYEKVVNWILRADRDVQTEQMDWRFLWTDLSSDVVPGTAAIAAPADLSVWDEEGFYMNFGTSNGRPLKWIEYAEWRRSIGVGATTPGTPEYVVCKPDGSLFLSPTPVAAETLTSPYWKNPVAMVLATDESVIPDKFRRIIVARAKLYFGEEEDAPDVYKAASGEYAELFTKLLASESLGKSRYKRGTAPAFVIQPS